ncbi:MAG: hypothetical protein M3373_06370 [Gemmatimonadota bacterium]|nr:hypothetical protein [Gemmatimonadota bacterium]
MKGRLLTLTLSGVVLSALAACGDPLRFEAQREVVNDTLTLFALTGTPVTAPSALNTFLHQAVRLDGTSSFDLVVDIDESGQVELQPVQLVGGSGGRTAFQVTDTPFSEVAEAPRNGYAAEALTVAIGQTVLVRAEPLICAGQLRPEIYSKLVIEGIDLVARTLKVRMTVDPNCGFVSFVEGIPER